MCRPWLKCYPTQTTQMLKVQTYRNIQIDTDVLRSSSMFVRRGWLRWESIKGMLCDRGGRLLSLVFILTQHKVKKAACDRKEDWCAEYPPPPLPPYSSSSSSLLLVSDRQGFHRARDWFSPHPEIGHVFHIGWYETFREGLGGELCRGGGIVLVEMTRWWCGDRQDWLELRKKCKTETEMEKQRHAPWDWRDWPAASIQPSRAERLVSSRLVLLLDKLSSGV